MEPILSVLVKKRLRKPCEDQPAYNIIGRELVELMYGLPVQGEKYREIDRPIKEYSSESVTASLPVSVCSLFGTVGDLYLLFYHEMHRSFHGYFHLYFLLVTDDTQNCLLADRLQSRQMLKANPSLSQNSYGAIVADRFTVEACQHVVRLQLLRSVTQRCNGIDKHTVLALAETKKLPELRIFHSL